MVVVWKCCHNSGPHDKDLLDLSSKRAAVWSRKELPGGLLRSAVITYVMSEPAQQCYSRRYTPDSPGKPCLQRLKHTVRTFKQGSVLIRADQGNQNWQQVCAMQCTISATSNRNTK